jgi:hypothetical protein
VQLLAVVVGVHPDRHHRRLVPGRQRRRLDRLAQHAGDRHLGHRRDGVPVRRARHAGGVDVRRVRHRQHVAAVVVDRFERAVRGSAAMHQIADRARHRGPVDRHLADPGGRRHVRGRVQLGQRHAVRRVAAAGDPVLPVGPGVRLGRH